MSPAHRQYFEDIHSVRDGTEIEPIVITGPASAVLQGIGGEGIVLIKHDYIHLEGFSVNGVGYVMFTSISRGGYFVIEIAGRHHEQ